MKSQIFRKPLPYLAIIAAHLIWGANFVVVKLTLTEFPVFALGFLRFAMASLLIAPFLLIEKKEEKIKIEHFPKIFLVGLLMVTFNIAFYYEGAVKVTAINASVLTMLTPIISVLGGWWFLREKIYGINLLGILLGLFGAIAVAGLPMIFLGNLTGGELTGSVFIILSDIAFVAGAIMSKQLFKIYSPLTVTIAAFFVGFLTFVIPAVNEYLSNPEWVDKVTILGILGLLFITLFSSISAYFAFQWGLSRLDFYKANLLQYIEPAVTATLAVPFLGERISYSFIVGAILVVLGVYWGTLGKQEHHHVANRHHRT